MLDQWLNSLPKTVIALVAIAIGFFVIVQSDPPRDVCDAQLELFKQQQADFLYGSPDDVKPKRRAVAQALYDRCKLEPSPGGCFDFMMRLRKMNADLAAIPSKCAEKVADDDLLKSWLRKSMKLMALISWGDRGPASVTKKNGWFDESDLSTYCGLMKHSTRLYGVDEMDEFRRTTLEALPESDKLDHETALQKSLLSVSCDAYR